MSDLKTIQALEQAKDLFESITYLRAKGVDGCNDNDILNFIEEEAVKGYYICKKALGEGE